ncbi:hypothetical protein [Fructobacillus papyrifericola]|uniref:Uncharacterized protein n=1 Tax=Fructobacillus papyrifericola TaxID=2713172 RepID=A0ABS5QU83_9LACO|nr:hypothetical protein [Fructobacillus papyrifericola]MBS9336744.1 hypothetical protein [Fructobacillus papyrifericola]
MRGQSILKYKNQNDITSDSVEKKKKRKVIVWLILLLLLLFSCGAGYFFNQVYSPTITKKIVSGDFLPDYKDAKKLTDEELAKYAQKKADASKFQMIINSDISVNKNSQFSDINIKNPTSNSYPIAVTITLDNGEVVYRSGRMDVGYEVKNPKLDKNLKVGHYKGVAIFKVYDEKTSKEKGKVSTAITIVVK